MLLLYAVALGLIAGFATRGNVTAIGRVKVRLWPLALAGLAFQAVLFSSPVASVVGVFGPSLYVASTTIVLMTLVLNLRQPGFALILAGALANFMVILANGGQMPASPEAIIALTGIAAVPTTDFSNSVLAVPGAPFHYLGDIFVLPRPFPFANVFSIGDVLIGIGGAWFIVAAMHGRGHEPRQRPRGVLRTAETANA
jgi:Family of unknown function (DUF5317)